MPASAAAVQGEVGRMMAPIIEKILNDTVVERARSFSDAAGLPEEFRDGIGLRREDSGASDTSPEWSVVNSFKGKFGEPLANGSRRGRSAVT